MEGTANRSSSQRSCSRRRRLCGADEGGQNFGYCYNPWSYRSFAACKKHFLNTIHDAVLAKLCSAKSGNGEAGANCASRQLRRKCPSWSYALAALQPYGVNTASPSDARLRNPSSNFINFTTSQSPVVILVFSNTQYHQIKSSIHPLDKQANMILSRKEQRKLKKSINTATARSPTKSIGTIRSPTKSTDASTNRLELLFAPQSGHVDENAQAFQDITTRWRSESLATSSTECSTVSSEVSIDQDRFRYSLPSVFYDSEHTTSTLTSESSSQEQPEGMSESLAVFDRLLTCGRSFDRCYQIKPNPYHDCEKAIDKLSDRQT